MSTSEIRENELSIDGAQTSARVLILSPALHLPFEWVRWPGVAVAAGATIFHTAQSVRLSFRNHRKSSS